MCSGTGKTEIQCWYPTPMQLMRVLSFPRVILNPPFYQLPLKMYTRKNTHCNSLLFSAKNSWIKFKCYDVMQIFINVEFTVYAVHSDFSLTPLLTNKFSLLTMYLSCKKTRSKMYTTCSDHTGIFLCYLPKSWYSVCSSVKPIIFLNQQN